MSSKLDICRVLIEDKLTISEGLEKQKAPVWVMTNSNTDAFLKSEALVKAILSKMPMEKKARENFLCHLFLLYLGLRGRYNFLNIARFGQYTEQTYRSHFEQEFDFASFNEHLILGSCSGHLVNAFDPSYISKSGKRTPGLGKFWSGCAGAAKWGLELGGFASVDIQNNTAMALEAVQTPGPKELASKGESLVDHYARIVVERADLMLRLSPYLAVDGYFAKQKFVRKVCEETALHLVCKFRTDADLYYLYEGEYKGRGRPALYDGKVEVKNIDPAKLPLCYQDEEVALHSGVVYAKSLKRKVRIAYAKWKKEGEFSGKYAIFFSTDTKLEGHKIYLYYKSRFQIEFLFRDAKQFCGLNHSQARSENKLHFHFNAALTTVSIAKAALYLSIPKVERKSFSMRDIKTYFLNKLTLDRFLEDFEVDTDIELNIRTYKRWLSWGKIAA